MAEDTTIMGPVQLLVLGFEGDRFTGEILPELRRLKDADVIRMIDLLFVRKDADGEVDVLHVSDLTAEESAEFGADGHVIDDAEVWHLEEAIPPGTAAAIALIEHRWAIPFRDAVVRAGGVPLADEWIHAADLIAAGARVAAG